MTGALLFFPVPAPDELLYSLLARYARMAGGLPPRQAVAQLLGSENRAAAWDLPCHLGVLSKALNVPVADLIDRHTLLPYYGSALLPGRLRILRQWMIGSCHGGDIHAAAGVTASAVAATHRLRYCAQCAKDDAREWSAPIWRRLHQCPGVIWCPTHARPLIESGVALSARSHKHQAVELRTAMRSGDTELKIPDPARASAIAVRSQELLAGKGPVGANAWRRRHLDQMRRGGWLTAAGRVRWASLLPQACVRLPKVWWESLGLRTDIEHPSHWIAALVRSPRKGSHPLQHLMTEALLTELTSDAPARSASNPKQRRRPSMPAKPGSKVITADRRAWRELAAKFPVAGAKVWRAKRPGLYMRLYRHSPAWLRGWNAIRRKPQLAKRQGRIDWKSRDRQLTQQLSEAFRVLVTAAHSKRKRVTVASLLRELRVTGLHRNQLAKLPRLRTALSRLVETPEQFLRRRLANAVRDWAQHYAHAPEPWQVLRSAAVRSPWPSRAKSLARSAIALYPWLQRQYWQAPQDMQDADQGLALGTPHRGDTGRRRIS